MAAPWRYDNLMARAKHPSITWLNTPSGELFVVKLSQRLTLNKDRAGTNFSDTYISQSGNLSVNFPLFITSWPYSYNSIKWHRTIVTSSCCKLIFILPFIFYYRKLKKNYNLRSFSSYIMKVLIFNLLYEVFCFLEIIFNIKYLILNNVKSNKFNIFYSWLMGR